MQDIEPEAGPSFFERAADQQHRAGRHQRRAGDREPGDHGLVPAQRREQLAQTRVLHRGAAVCREFGVDRVGLGHAPAVSNRDPADHCGTRLGGTVAVEAALNIGAMPGDGWVFDMVTEPAETPLLRAARARGLATHDGIAMLVEQAAASFMLLFGHEAPRGKDAELMAILRP